MITRLSDTEFQKASCTKASLDSYLGKKKKSALQCYSHVYVFVFIRISYLRLSEPHQETKVSYIKTI